MKTLLRIGRPILVVLALVSTLGTASAQVEPGLPNLPMPQPRKQLPTPDEFADQQIAAFDKNADKKVTWAEFSAKLRAAFDDMDKRKRGYLTREEIKQAYIKALVAAPRPAETDE